MRIQVVSPCEFTELATQMEGTGLGSLDPESEREAKVDAMPYPMAFPEGSTPSNAGYGVAWLIDTKFQSVSAKDRS